MRDADLAFMARFGVGLAIRAQEAWQQCFQAYGGVVFREGVTFEGAEGLDTMIYDAEAGREPEGFGSAACEIGVEDYKGWAEEWREELVFQVDVVDVVCGATSVGVFAAR